MKGFFTAKAKFGLSRPLILNLGTNGLTIQTVYFIYQQYTTSKTFGRQFTDNRTTD